MVAFFITFTRNPARGTVLSYYSDTLVKALGGAYFLGAEDMDYGNWTPNAIRTIALFPDAIVVEYHKPYKGGKIDPTTVNINKVTQEIQKNPTVYARLLTTITAKKNLGTLEELFIADQLNIDYTGFVQRYQQKKNRLRFVTEIRWQPGFTTDFIANLRTLRQNDKEFIEVYTRYLAENQLVLNAFSAEKEDAPWYSSYQLVPQIYKADKKESPLGQHFLAIAGKYLQGTANEESNQAPLTEGQQEALKYLAQAVATDTRVEKEILAVYNTLENLTKEQATKLEKYPTLGADESVLGLSYLLEHHNVCSEELKQVYYSLGFADAEDSATAPKRARVMLGGLGIAKPSITIFIGKLRKAINRAGETPETLPSRVLEQFLALADEDEVNANEAKLRKKEKVIAQLREIIGRSDGISLYLSMEDLLAKLDDKSSNLSKPQVRVLKSTFEGYPKLYRLNEVLGTATPGFDAWGLTTKQQAPDVPDHYQAMNLSGLVDKLYQLVPLSLRVSSGNPVGFSGKLEIIEKHFITDKGQNKQSFTWDNVATLLNQAK